MALIPKSIFELGVDEAYEILTVRFGMDDLPPLDAIENEDWGRDLLLGKFLLISEDELHHAGLIVPLGRDPDEGG